LEYINCTKGFHCGISIHAYIGFWSNSPPLLLFLIPPLSLLKIIFIGRTGVWIQGLALYHLSPAPSPFCFCNFSSRVLCLCQGWPELQSFYLHFLCSRDDRHVLSLPAFTGWCEGLTNFFAWGWPWIFILQISISWVAAIKVVSNCVQLLKTILMGFIIIFPYMHMKYFDHIHPSFHPLTGSCTQIVPILHSSHLFFFKFRLPKWERICNISLFQSVLFCLWFPVPSIFLQTKYFHSSLWLNNILLCIYSIFFIHLSVDEYLVWFHSLAVVNVTAINMGVHWMLVAHACNPSYSGGRDQEDCSSKPAWANSSTGPYLKKILHKKRAVGVTQAVDPEFKPQYPPPPHTKTWELQVSLLFPDSHSFQHMPRSGIRGSYGSAFFSFWGASILISVTALVYILTNSV
jgi:hypothetical protein